MQTDEIPSSRAPFPSSKVLVNWNIRQGGGRRIAAISETLSRLRPHTVVLTEFRKNGAGAALREHLAARGLRHQAWGPAEVRQNTVFIASRSAFDPVTFESELGPESHRCLLARFDGFRIFAFYFPILKAKVTLFEFILRLSPEGSQGPTLLVGDFNTGKHHLDEEGRVFWGPQYMEMIEKAGWVDAWRHVHGGKREYTWMSAAGRGFRLDHAFASAGMLSRISSVRYLHKPRTAGVSDHSAMILRFQG
jgi:exodeoxyribonuclease III